MEFGSPAQLCPRATPEASQRRASTLGTHINASHAHRTLTERPAPHPAALPNSTAWLRINHRSRLSTSVDSGRRDVPLLSSVPLPDWLHERRIHPSLLKPFEPSTCVPPCKLPQRVAGEAHSRSFKPSPSPVRPLVWPGRPPGRPLLQSANRPPDPPPNRPPDPPPDPPRDPPTRVFAVVDPRLLDPSSTDWIPRRWRLVQSGSDRRIAQRAHLRRRARCRRWRWLRPSTGAAFVGTGICATVLGSSLALCFHMLFVDVLALLLWQALLQEIVVAILPAVKDRVSKEQRRHCRLRMRPDLMGR